jgi:glycosyltransferase involved in cell wall biosynthesis
MYGVEVSVVIPTMNEEMSIGQVLQEIKEAFSQSPYTYEVLVVDTLSEDRTVEIARQMGARVIEEERRGYGQAYMTGFAEAQGRYIATLDADLTYPAALIPSLVSRLKEEDLDFISCERMTMLSADVMGLPHRLGNTLLNLAIRLLFGHTLRDSQSGMWVLRREALERLQLSSTGMPFSEEIKLEALEKGLRFVEVPIRYRPRVGDAKLRSLADGWANLRYLLLRRLRR